MTDISAYMQRLEWLKEWMVYRIEYEMPVKKVLSHFEQTGMLLMTDVSNRLISFETFCQFKNNNVWHT